MMNIQFTSLLLCASTTKRYACSLWSWYFPLMTTKLCLTMFTTHLSFILSFIIPTDTCYLLNICIYIYPYILFQVPHVFMGNTLKHRNMSSDNKKCSPPPKSHHKACCPTYPRNPQIHRFPVLEDQVSWRVQYNEYQPVDYTAPSVTSQPVWADFDIR